VQLQAEQKGLAFELRLAPDLPEFVNGDPARLRQILTNLLSNALKFTPAGSITFDVRVRERREQQVTLLFLIKDTGIGIAKQQQARIFEAFEQADASTTRRFGGTGLGLSIVSRLVTGMGGSINLVSEPEKGSGFQVELTFDAGVAPNAA
jgi:two-component system, sensor histidine kinase and response regulator